MNCQIMFLKKKKKKKKKSVYHILKILSRVRICCLLNRSLLLIKERFCSLLGANSFSLVQAPFQKVLGVQKKTATLPCKNGRKKITNVSSPLLKIDKYYCFSLPELMYISFLMK